MENVANNTFAENEDIEEYEFKNNFINTPWDDRSNKSKCGTIALLLAIFFATLAGVVNSFFMHYKGFESDKHFNSGVHCQRVKMEDYKFAARIHSIATDELLCIGALVSATAVLASGACSKSGPVRLRLGNINHPVCKKGFPVDVIERIQHDGVISKKLILLSSYEDIGRCVHNFISIGTNIINGSRADVIGRTLFEGGGRMTLSRQPVTVTGNDCVCSGMTTKNLNNKKNTICVKAYARCPVLAGDLLVQGGRLFGLASTSVRRRDESKLACFADLKIITEQLREKEIDV